MATSVRSGAVVLPLTVTVRRIGSQPGGGAGGARGVVGVGGGGAGGEPVADVVARRADVGPVPAHAVILIRRRDGGFLERLVFDHADVAHGIEAGGLFKESIVLQRAADADRQLVFQEDAVEIEARAITFIA